MNEGVNCDELSRLSYVFGYLQLYVRFIVRDEWTATDSEQFCVLADPL